MNDLAGNDKQYKCRALVHLQLCKTAVENVTCIITKASSGQFPFLEFPFEFHGYVHLIQCISGKKKRKTHTYVDWSASVSSHVNGACVIDSIKYLLSYSEPVWFDHKWLLRNACILAGKSSYTRFTSFRNTRVCS